MLDKLLIGLVSGKEVEHEVIVQASENELLNVSYFKIKYKNVVCLFDIRYTTKSSHTHLT